MQLLRQIWIVARYELSDAIRSRRAAVTMILYVAGAVASINGFINILQRLENQIAETLGIKAMASAGAVTDALWKSHRFRHMMMELVGDKDIALDLLNVPPVALMYGWLAFMFIPMLVMLTSTGRVAEEIGTGSVRYVAQRCTRLAWCLGKFVGQAGLVVLALVVSVVGAWSVARFRLSGMDGLAVAGAMTVFAGKAWIYSLAFIGLAIGISQFNRSANQATAIGFVAWILMGILELASRFNAGPGIRSIWYGVEMLVPGGHRMDLWRLDPGSLLTASTFLLALGLCYMAVGHMYLARRDL